MTLYGIDVSHHQRPASLAWETIAEQSTFAIVRASYGTMRDRVTLDHVKRARAAGMKVGLYHFFRPSRPVQPQLDLFLGILVEAKIGPGDIVPVVDVEADPLPTLQLVTKAWQDPVRTMLATLRDRFGNAMVYITQREFGMLGHPEWLLTFPLWIAHYTGAAKPASPGNRPWTIWQHRVAPYLAFGPGGYDRARPELDQNRAVDLPLIGSVRAFTEPTAPLETDENDDGLEELILAKNQALLDDFVALESERVRDDMAAGQALRDYERSEDEPPDESADGKPRS